MAIQSPAFTYTLEDFINMQGTDNFTYRNFSILEKINGIELLDHNLLEDYRSQIYDICTTCQLDIDQYKRYRYFPDLLAYDIYGSTQLDFVILFCNDMADPKEFDLKVLKLPYGSKLRDILGQIYNSEQYYLANNKYMNQITNNIL
jgi:hypothetical protein